MKLYMHPVSTTCRPVMTFIAENGIEVEQQVVDLFSGEQYQPAFQAINPSSQVPVLEDGAFRLTESATILRYLAYKTGSPAYPQGREARARVDEALDWLNTGFYRSFGYALVYAQVLDPYKLPDETAQRLLVEAGKRSAERWLGILNDHLLRPGRTYLCGDDATIADHFGTGLLSVGEVIGCTFAAYPNVRRWYDAMRARPGWQEANAGLSAWADMARGPAYVTV